MKNKPRNAGENIYKNSYSGKAVEELQKVRQERMNVMEVLDKWGISKEGRITFDGVEIELRNYGGVKLNVQARKLFDMLLMKLSERLPYGEQVTREDIYKSVVVTVTLDDFMELCRLSDRKNAREQFRAAAKCIFNLYMVFDYEIWQGRGKKRKRVKCHCEAHLINATTEERPVSEPNEKEPVIDSKIRVDFSTGLLQYLCNRYIMPINLKIFSIDVRRHPHAYGVARHLTEVYRIRNNKGQPERIAVKSLLPYCPELPTVEEIKAKGNRDYWQKIYEPIQRDLDALADEYGIIDWHYCKKNGLALTEEELNTYKFEDWQNFLIEFSLPGYPEYTTKNGAAKTE